MTEEAHGGREVRASPGPPEGDRGAGFPEFDESWLNDRSEFQRNWVHGLHNPAGLHLQYRLEGDRVIAEWTPTHEHVGFPGVTHGGIVAAVLDDVMGRAPAMLHRWVVTGKLHTRFRAAAPVGTTLRVEGWMTRYTRRLVGTESRLLLPDGGVVAEATGVYLPVPDALLARMVEAWPGFGEYTGQERPPL